MTKVEFYCACTKLAEYVLANKPEELFVQYDSRRVNITADLIDMGPEEGSFFYEQYKNDFDSTKLLLFQQPVVYGRVELNCYSSYQQSSFCVLKPHVLFYVPNQYDKIMPPTYQRLSRIESAIHFLMEQANKGK